MNVFLDILYRFPATDHADLNFPTEVAMFGLPMGAVIESWPKSDSNQSTRPTFSTFCLNVSSEDGSISEKVYGASILFYEPYDDRKLSEDQSMLLEYSKSKHTLHSNK